MSDHKERRCQGSWVPRRAEVRHECRDCLRYVPTYAPHAEYIPAMLVNGQCVNKVTDSTPETGFGL